MVRRSDHCLPSDSDKFTIKLHSLPSKFPSSALLRALPPSEPRSLVGPSPCHPRAPPSAPQKLLPLCGHVGSSFGGAGAILIGDNHNSLYTRATLQGESPRVSPCPLRVVPPVFRPSRPSRRHFPSLFVSFGSIFSLPRLFPSLRVAFLPLVLTDRPCRIDRGYSAIVFVLSCSCCDCGSPGDSACLPLPRVLYWNLSFSLLFAFFILPLLVVWCSSVGIYFSSRRVYFQASSSFLFAFFYSPK